MALGLPQVILVGLVCVNLGLALAQHGRPRTAWNFGWHLIDASALIGLLWWGGFFR